MKITNISEAKSTLSSLIKRVTEGEEIVIGKAGRPVAKLVPYEQDTSARDLDQAVWRGKMWMAPDFDELPGEVLGSFLGEVEDESAT